MERYDDTAAYVCPHCGETIDTPADPGAGDEQEYIDDCPVCCNPLRIRVRFDASGGAVADASPENG